MAVCAQLLVKFPMAKTDNCKKPRVWVAWLELSLITSITSCRR